MSQIFKIRNLSSIPQVCQSSDVAILQKIGEVICENALVYIITNLKGKEKKKDIFKFIDMSLENMKSSKKYICINSNCSFLPERDYQSLALPLDTSASKIIWQKFLCYLLIIPKEKLCTEVTQT